MPKRTDIKKVLVIGSGPIVIGQAAEFDYAGTQACLALKEEGYEVILCNSNPATIMTDTSVADKVYMEPLTLEYVAKIIRYERPDAILPGIGGQTGLNLAMQLEKKGVLAECRTELLGTKSSSIERAEDREQFKELCEALGEPVLPSDIANTIEDGLRVAREIGYPVVLRPAFTLGGTGGGFAEDEASCRAMLKNALELSPVHQVLIEKSVKGYKEIEYEVMRDANDTAITVCNMENLDPVGVHTGDSVVVCPSQTLTNREYHMLRDSALKIIRALDELGVDYIEAGNPCANPKDEKLFDFAREHLRLKNAQLAAFGMTCRAGVPAEEDAQLRRLAAFDAGVVSLVGKACAFQVREVLRATLEENLRMVSQSIAFLASRGLAVFFDAEHFFDGYAKEPAYALEVLAAAVRALYLKQPEE